MGRRGRKNLTDEYFYFVTTTIKNFTPIFKYPKCCDLLIENINHYQKNYNFTVLAYVIMPTHFHWILNLKSAKGTVSDIMRDIKKYSAWQILDYLKEIGQITILNSLGKPIKSGQKRQLWMHRFDDQVIRNEKMFWEKLKYIHKNPVKAGLISKAGDYKYSSARSFDENKDLLVKIDREFVGIEMVDYIK